MLFVEDTDRARPQVSEEGNRLHARRIELRTRTLVRRLELDGASDRIVEAMAVDRQNPDTTIRVRARQFVVAAGYTWSSHLLLLSKSEFESRPRHSKISRRGFARDSSSWSRGRGGARFRSSALRWLTKYR